MKETFVDTNIFMRLFDSSDPKQTDRAKKIFEQAAAGKARLIVGPPVLFELSWVLKSAMNRSNQEILDVLEAIVAWRGMKILDKEYVQRAIALAKATKQGFADSYIAVTAQDQNLEVATFNQKHFSKLGVELRQFDAEK
ncbi:PIN domain-containing protein [Synergistaceae bacterium OttesenSCG-928-I11]|nr:PIN domain-containing protein [Synergistaceae bacterium OttesenSCG-928-I11]